MDSSQGDRLLRGYLSSRWVLLAVGIITPIGILVVNAAAFVMRNLAQFRIGIAICALISSLVLNGLTASWLLRLARRRSIAIYLQHPDWATIAATIVVIATSVGAAIDHLVGCGVDIEAGPVPRWGAAGRGVSVYFRDPDGSLLEFISYASTEAAG